MVPGFADWIMTHTALTVFVLARTIGVSWTAPALATPGLDFRLRLVIGGLLGLILAPTVVTGFATDPTIGFTWSMLVSGFVTELVIGLALGWSASLIVAGARQAGELVGMQSGLAPAALFDPDLSEEMTAFGHLYGLIALAVFLAADGPLVVVRALLESYQLIPPGVEILTETSIRFAFDRVSQALALSLRASAPIALALALAGIVLGLLGRAAPSLQLLSLAMPVRTGLGLTLMFFGIATLVTTLTVAWGTWPGPISILGAGGP